MGVMAVCGSWILCVGALLASAVRSDLSIRGCKDGKVDAVEGTDPVFTCGDYGRQGPRWTVYEGEGQELYSGSCSKYTCTPWNKQFQLHVVEYEKRDLYTSRLTIKNITRDSARQLVCSDSSTRVLCDLKIIAPAILKKCDVSVRDWRVEARCVVEHMYSSDGRYSCRWRVNNTELTSYFQDPPTAYWFDTRAYRKGVCYSSYTMPNSAGNYKYSIHIDPGVWTTVKTLNIELPGDPMYTCHDVVQEGSSVTCKCTSSKPGNPPAEFFWNGQNTDTLYLYDIQREDSGKKRTCFMTWGLRSYISRKAVLTLTVVATEVMAVRGVLILCCGTLLASAVCSELSIRGCEDGSVDAVEDSDPVFTCDDYSTQESQWTVYNHLGQEIFNGSCSSKSCTPSNKQFTLDSVKHEEPNMYTSTLLIKNITRDSARKLVYSNSRTNVSCDLRIIDVKEDTIISFTCGQYTDQIEWSSLYDNHYRTFSYIGYCNDDWSPAVLKDCDVSIKNWQVYATCEVENMNPSDRSYSCTWRVNNDGVTNYFQGPLTKNIFDTQEGLCYSNHTMPDSPGKYTYSIQKVPGLWNTVKTLNIERPGNPVYTCSNVVQEGFSVTCTCTSLNPGSPPAQFVWEGRNTDTLYLYNVKREDNGTRHTCLMTWGPKKFIGRQAVLILKVAVPVSIVPKTCKVQLSRWKVYGVCTIQWLNTTSDTTEFRWLVSYKFYEWTTPDYLKGLFSSSSFVTVDSVGYKRRNCSFEQEMPVSERNYTYSLTVSSHPDDQFATSLSIVRPWQARHNCSLTLYEGSSISCKCMSSKVGNPPAEVYWEEVNSDTLYLRNIQRQDSGNKYTCRLIWGPVGQINRTTVYNLVVLTPVSIDPSSCSVQLSGWKVSGVCTVQWLPAIKTPTCNWIVKSKEKAEKIPGVQSIASYQLTDPVNYINCSFVHQMPVINGNYTYSINVSSHPADQFSTSVYIEKPDALQHNCTKMLLEGSNTTCTCFTLNLGSPPAQIRWAESSNEQLVIEGISRERNGTVTTCNLTWGVIRYTTTYTINVAFGPSVAYISSSEETSGNETKMVLVCTASDVYPSALFQWNILCETETHNETTSRCPLSTAVLADQMAIECTARNQIFGNVSTTSIYVLKPKHNSFQGWIIPVSVVAVLVVVLVVIVAVIVCIKRRKVVNKPNTQTPIERFPAPSGDVYTIAGTTTVDHRDNEYVTVRDTTYMNTICQTQTPVVRCAAPSGDLYSIVGPATGREVKQEETELNTLVRQRPADHFAAPSGDVYAIAGPTTAGKDKHVTKLTNNTSYAPKSRSGYQARDNTHTTNIGRESNKKAVKPKPARFGKQSSQNLPATGYINVPAVPTDSGLGVYHVVPCAAMSETPGADARVLDTSKLSEDEYNVLRFQENQTGQEDHAVTYSHLAFK